MFKSTKQNTACLFHDENQGLDKLSQMICTIIWQFINAKYNGVIKDFTMDEVMDLVKSQEEKWEFSYTEGAYTSHSNKAFLEYLDSKGIQYTCETTTDDSVAYEWAERGFAVWVWIKVNDNYWQDRKDWTLELNDYSKYKGNIGHFSNYIIWTCRGEFDCTDNGKEMCIDSYFVKNSTYECDIKKVLEQLDQNTKYILY